MPSISHEHCFYHACATACDGDYPRVSALRETARSWRDAWERMPDRNVSPEKLYEELLRSGIQLALRDDEVFPALLREIPHPPHALYYRGSLPLPVSRTIAVVGTRKATRDGLEMARTLGHDLARRGVVVASGLALGIDAAAHTGALTANGITVAVLAGGLDAIYPAHHQQLANRILAAGGVLFSEYPPGSPTYPSRFLERNRLVSGLSQAVIVVEAPMRSGALATARFALDQNRDVFTVPGPARHHSYAGCHSLIKSGAGLLTDIEDLGDLLPPLSTPAPASYASEEERYVAEALAHAHTALDLDTLCERSTLEPHCVQRALTKLVMNGLVRENNGMYAIADRSHENTDYR